MLSVQSLQCLPSEFMFFKNRINITSEKKGNNRYKNYLRHKDYQLSVFIFSGNQSLHVPEICKRLASELTILL